MLEWLFGRRLADTAAMTPDERIAWLTKGIDRLTDASLLAQLSEDYSGYRREAALRRVIALRTANLLPVLASRLNDHIPIIGALARSEMLAQVELAPVADLLAVLPGVLRLRDAGRADHSAWLGQFESALYRRAGGAALRETVMTAPAPVARACMAVLQRQGGLDSSFIEQLLANSADLVLLRGALAAARTMPASSGVWWTALRSKLGPVRVAAAVQVLAGEPDERKDAYAQTSLLDNQAGVRAAAARYLKAGGFDVVGYYCAVLADTSSPVGRLVNALAALDALAAKPALPSIRHPRFPSPRVRRTALKVWIKLAPAQKDEVALLALHDPAPSVRRFAHTAVNRFGAYIPRETVFATLRRKEDASTYRTFCERDRWDWLIYLGEAAADLSPADPGWTRLRGDLRRWAYSFTQFGRPDAEQVRRLSDPALQRQLDTLAAGRSDLLGTVHEALARLR